MIKNKSKYPKHHFNIIRPKLIKMIIRGYRVSAMAKELKMKHNTLSSMMTRNTFSVVRIRHDHKMGVTM